MEVHLSELPLKDALVKQLLSFLEEAKALARTLQHLNSSIGGVVDM